MPSDATPAASKDAILVGPLTAGDVVLRPTSFLRRWLRTRRNEAQTVEALMHPRPSPSSRFPWMRVSFLLFVILPSIAVVLYLAFLASAQYASESRFIVRPAVPASGLADSLEAAATSLGVSTSYSSVAQNSYVVAQYIRSRTAVDDLLPVVDLRSLYSRPEIDFWARLPINASHEDLVEYWQKMVKAYVDGPSSVVTVEVRAFRPEDALQISKAILDISERLVNQMSEKARRNVLHDAEEEVRRADANLRSTLNALRDVRDAEGLVDPAKSADSTVKLLGQLMAEKAAIEGDLHVASRTLEKSSPTVRQLTSRLEIVGRQISALRSSLAGSEQINANLAASLRKFEQLEVQRFLADKALDFAEDNLVRARVRAERQNLYFMVFVSPTSPTTATLPRRIAYSVLLPITFLILWGIVALTCMAVADHRI